MKATFPARDFPWLTYTFPVFFVAVAVLVTIAVYGSLPTRLATTFDFNNNPTGFMNKATYVTVVIGFMAAMLFIMIVMDRYYIYPIFPVPMMSAICGAIQLFCLIIHLLILEVPVLPETGILGTLVILLGLPCVYVYLHMTLYRGEEEELPHGRPLWTDTPPQGWLSVVFFVFRPILPHEVIAYAEGLVLKSRTYRFMIPWKQIRSIRRATVSEAMGAMGMRVVSAPSRSVMLHLSGQKLPMVFSIDNEARLIGEWEKHRAT
jgi:hypothetical protein